MLELKKTAREVEALMDKASDNTKNLSGMTYQEGIVAACRWMLGEDDENPLN